MAAAFFWYVSRKPGQTGCQFLSLTPASDLVPPESMTKEDYQDTLPDAASFFLFFFFFFLFLFLILVFDESPYINRPLFSFAFS